MQEWYHNDSETTDSGQGRPPAKTQTGTYQGGARAGDDREEETTIEISCKLSFGALE